REVRGARREVRGAGELRGAMARGAGWRGFRSAGRRNVTSMSRFSHYNRPRVPSQSARAHVVRKEHGMKTVRIALAGIIALALSTGLHLTAKDKDNNQGERGNKLRATLIGFNEVPSVSTPARGHFEA